MTFSLDSCIMHFRWISCFALVYSITQGIYTTNFKKTTHRTQTLCGNNRNENPHRQKCLCGKRQQEEDIKNEESKNI